MLNYTNKVIYWKFIGHIIISLYSEIEPRRGSPTKNQTISQDGLWRGYTNLWTIYVRKVTVQTRRVASRGKRIWTPWLLLCFSAMSHLIRERIDYNNFSCIRNSRQSRRWSGKYKHINKFTNTSFYWDWRANVRAEFNWGINISINLVGIGYITWSSQRATKNVSMEIHFFQELCFKKLKQYCVIGEILSKFIIVNVGLM